MAADVISAILTYYDTLSFSGRPGIYFDEAPAKTTANVTLLPPYVVLKDDGTTPDYTEEFVPVETTRVRFLVYAKRLEDAVAVASGIKYNGGTAVQQQGFDFVKPADFPLTSSVGVLLEGGFVRTKERRAVVPDRLDGSRVHLVELSYTVVVRIGNSP